MRIANFHSARLAAPAALILALFVPGLATAEPGAPAPEQKPCVLLTFRFEHAPEWVAFAPGGKSLACLGGALPRLHPPAGEAPFAVVAAAGEEDLLAALVEDDCGAAGGKGRCFTDS